MNLNPVALAAIACVSLSACGATVQDERYSQVSTFNGTYEVRTRTIDYEDGRRHTRSDVKVGGYWYPCKIDSPGDCEAAAEVGEDMGDDRGSRGD